MSTVTVEATTYEAIAPLREELRSRAGCQIVRDSILRRGLAQPYAIGRDGVTVGYGGVWVEHDPGRVMEFWVTPGAREIAPACYAEFVRVCAAHELEAQTNLPLMHAMMTRFGSDPKPTHFLFEDVGSSSLGARDWVVRAPTPADGEVDAEWVVDDAGRVVAEGGLLGHYNPPYLDVYMSVEPERRGEGIGAWLVQELCRIARSRGSVPAARCSIENEASRRTLLRGGMREVGTIECARVDPARLRGVA